MIFFFIKGGKISSEQENYSGIFISSIKCLCKRERDRERERVKKHILKADRQVFIKVPPPQESIDHPMLPLCALMCVCVCVCVCLSV